MLKLKIVTDLKKNKDLGKTWSIKIKAEKTFYLRKEKRKTRTLSKIHLKLEYLTLYT